MLQKLPKIWKTWILNPIWIVSYSYVIVLSDFLNDYFFTKIIQNSSLPEQNQVIFFEKSVAFSEYMNFKDRVLKNILNWFLCRWTI